MPMGMGGRLGMLGCPWVWGDVGYWGAHGRRKRGEPHRCGKMRGTGMPVGMGGVGGCPWVSE